MRRRKRTVTELLTVKKKDTLSNRIRYRKYSRHTFVSCRSKNIARRFLADAEAEGFTFADGTMPTQKETWDIYAIRPDLTICYAGWASHLLLKHGGGNVVKIDYGKYISGATDYQM